LLNVFKEVISLNIFNKGPYYTFKIKRESYFRRYKVAFRPLLNIFKKLIELNVFNKAPYYIFIIKKVYNILLLVI
jgi:hypothetical protein